MSSPELLRSWERTERYLRDARSHLSQITEAEFSDGLAQFDEFLDHNELGLAFETLDSLANESQWELQRVFELLALAAASMGMCEAQRRLDTTISELRGSAYVTSLPGTEQ